MLLQEKRDQRISVSEALRLASSEFRKAHIGCPLQETEVLLGFVLGYSRSEIYLHLDQGLSSREQCCFQVSIKKRLGRVPLQYIIKRQSFRYLDLRMKEGVFIPRPETELLAECVIEFVKFRESPAVIDVGTGTGAIALSIASEVPGSHVFAVDICPKALALAAYNTNHLGLENQVCFVKSDLFEELDTVLEGKVDAIVSNPPYIATGDVAELPSEVRDFELAIALDGGEDGLRILRRLVLGACQLLKPKGLLALEVGYGQAGNVVKIIKATHKFDDINTVKDYSGIERVVFAHAMCNQELYSSTKRTTGSTRG